MERVASVILAGGKGTRLFPLTNTIAKPAVTFGGRLKLIDIPISYSLNANINDIFVITQYKSATIQKHIEGTYGDKKSIQILSPDRKAGIVYEGTADAVRKNLDVLRKSPHRYFLILSGDQIYDFDYNEFMQYAKSKNASCVIACLPCTKKDAKRLGIMQIDEENRITNFVEKPQDQKVINSLVRPNMENEPKPLLGSMGIYLFERKALFALLEKDTREDFGKHLIPNQILDGNTYSFTHHGYWEDIGTIATFYEANLALTRPSSPLKTPVAYTTHRLPPPRIIASKLENSIVCEGVNLEADEIFNSILGAGSVIKKGTKIHNSILLGGDSAEATLSSPFIGENCTIDKAIIDKNVVIGNGVTLTNKYKFSKYDSDSICIRDGIIIVKNGARIPDGFSL